MKKLFNYLTRMLDFMEDVDEYLGQREDADFNGESYTPNEAMRLRRECQELLDTLRRWR